MWKGPLPRRLREPRGERLAHQGLRQLEEEGAIQVLVTADGARRDYVLAAVGDLQFDVVAARLAGEYGVETTLERLPHVAARAVLGTPEAVAAIVWPYAGALKARDHQDRLVALFGSQRELDYCVERNPAVQFRPLADLG